MHLTKLFEAEDQRGIQLSAETIAHFAATYARAG